MTARQKMFVRLVWRALLERRRRLSIALAALAIGATLAAALLSTYADLESKMGGELRAFGANIVVLPQGAAGATFDEAAAARASARAASLPFLYVVGKVNDEPAVLAGTRFDRLPPFTRGWQWDGRMPAAAGECAVGEQLAGHFRVRAGSTLSLGFSADAEPAQPAAECRVTGVVATGTSEDNQVLMPLEALQTGASLAGRISLLQVIAGGSRAEVDAVRSRIAAAMGGAADVRLLRAVADSSARVLLKVRGMLFAVTGIVLAIIGLCVMTTLSAIVLERRKDIAVMKALGGTQPRITALFLAEAAALALCGGPLGYVAGTVLARWLGRAVFQSPVAFRFAVLPEVLIVTLVVALLATLVPLRIVRRVEPAAILKGE